MKTLSDERPGISQELLLIVIAAVSITIALVVLLLGTMLVEEAGAADYYIYKDGAGRTWLSNIAPSETADKNVRAPFSEIKRYDWRDATDAEIAQTARENSAIAAANLQRERIAVAEKLAAAIAEQNAALRQAQGERTQVNQITVVEGSRIFLPHPSTGSGRSGAQRARR